MLIAAPYSLSAYEKGQLGPVDYLAGPGDVWGSRLKAEGTLLVCLCALSPIIKLMFSSTPRAPMV